MSLNKKNLDKKENVILNPGTEILTNNSKRHISNAEEALKIGKEIEKVKISNGSIYMHKDKTSKLVSKENIKLAREDGWI